ncbi:MAG: DUF2306 domain-containing protein [Flavobacteriales bacterium]|nr:DUF2306 domain-containing protein [Flavobacteriales bacterium]PIY10879.1 MAG: hypothetical protein COZ17_08555 [Flavobacteriaceae bacterium CG_4_10_14_3_um_filter_33_47]PJB18387.1 MAG: hypothetical protein CO117_08255 [Flavobacteriaceae bacterium CG_4_9_14_3_um_filter_33_16]NCP52529.1 DUF2306 domain-containing protein [Flavobacteriales bacterium]NCQ13177.1 DUF2306 domain-containing protein [Flavobacteriales bacterium]
MTYETLMFVHLATVFPAFILGTVSLILRKGTPVHVVIGRIYMVLMLFTAFVTLFMSAKVGPTLWNHFGWIHLFSFLTIYTVPTAYLAIKNKNVKAHKRKMILLYFGAIIIAGGFTFAPGRYLYSVFFE